ncbi:hypothetical protein, conserved [Eimeria acervulina]|uniref:Transmembrane protein n=1 Tax=Eimeria acervulina TaxID=5801 RepID=U6GMM9_EIMAC|nr:hypothetical protein, conserved [Eimeria acervulina]CDI79874.1 hypothetical protein, conserved [Eimeria acervulina]
MFSRLLESMKHNRMHLCQVQCLGAMALLLVEVKATMLPFDGWGDKEAESLGGISGSEGQWTAGSYMDGSINEAALSSEPTLTNSLPSLLAGPAYSSLDSTSHFISPEELSQSDQPKANEAVAPSPPPQKNKEGRRVLSSSTFIAAILLSFACLGLLTASTLAVHGLPRLEELYSSQKKEQQEQQDQQEQTQQDQRTQKQHQQQPPQQEDERTAEEKLLWKRLDEMQQLSALLTVLTDILGIVDEDTHAAFNDVRNCIENAKQVQQKILEGSLETWESPESVMKSVVDSGASALSRLCEAARRQGLWLAHQVKNIEPPSILSFMALDAVSRVNSKAANALHNYLGSQVFSYKSSMKQAAKAKAELKLLPALTNMGGSEIMAAIAANAEFLKMAFEVARAGRRSTVELADAATLWLVSHSVRQQVCMYRECRDLLKEQKVLCRLERQRQESLPQGDIATLETLDLIDKELKRGEQLLKAHREEIEQLHKKKDITSAEVAKEQAKEVGEELKALLATVASHMGSIPSIATDACENPEVRRLMEAVATRASKDAGAAAKKTKDILSMFQSRAIPTQSLMEIERMADHQEPVQDRLTNPSILQELEKSLEAARDRARLAYNDALAASARTKQYTGGDFNRMKKLVNDAQKAAMEAERILGDAETLWFQWQLVESMELDVQVSARMSQRAAAAAERNQQQQEGDSEVSFARKKQFESLLKQVNALTSAVRAQSDVKALASTAAALKGAAMQLVVMVQDGHHSRIGMFSP